MFFLQSQQRKSHIEDSQPSNRELQLFNGLWFTLFICQISTRICSWSKMARLRRC